MAPDLSAAQSTPRRPRAATATATATTVSPTMAPFSTQHQSSAYPPTSPTRLPTTPPPPAGMADQDITSTAQGPLRHPKPLTPSDLHLVLEKEQEAMVNRLTRELSLLRQQTASVASTTSSTSNFNEPTDALHTSPPLSGSHHTLSRRQRSSSSLSANTPAAPGVQAAAASVTGIAPSRDSSHPFRSTDHSHPRTIRSREPSLTSRRPSIGSLSSNTQNTHGEQLAHFGSPSVYPRRNSVSQTHLGLSSNPQARYEEAILQRMELETIKRENEQLRKRIRELEGVSKKQKEAETGTLATSG